MSLGKGAVLQGANNNILEMTPSGSGSIMAAHLASNGAIFKNMSLKGNGFGYIYIEDNTEFINSHITTDSGGPAFTFMNAPCAISLKDHSSMRGIIQVFNYANAEGCTIEITDDSVLECEALLLDNVDLNVNHFGNINYLNDNISTFNCGIHVTGMGTLKFMPDGNYSPSSDITAGMLGQILIGENSILNMNSANFTIEAGSKITLQESARLNTNYTMPAQTSIYAGNKSSICGNINFSENSSLRVGSENTHHIIAGSVVNFYSGSKIWLNQASELIVDEGAVLNLYGGMTIVYAGGSNITNYGEFHIFGEINETTNVMPDLPNKGEQWRGIISGVGSKTSISYCTFTGATTAISGTPDVLRVSGCTFNDCQNGINLSACSDFRIVSNTFTGNGYGVAVSVTQSGGYINNNTITGFYKGINVMSCSPTLVQNTITDCYLNGLYVAGNNTYLSMVNPIQIGGTIKSGEELGIDNSELNNTLYNNGVDYIQPPIGHVYGPAQIFMVSNSNIYLSKGWNNIYSNIDLLPCIRTLGLIPEGVPVRMQLIYAPENFWGYGTVNNSLFALSLPYYIDYSNYRSSPYGTNPVYANVSGNDNAQKLLGKAFGCELDGNYDKAIKEYEKIIDKYPESSEALVAYAKLPENYQLSNYSFDPLLAVYDNKLANEDSNKKFFKELKVSSHIKAKNYDSAIALSEEMKLEADTEEEIILCDIDIAIANMLKNSNNKSGSKLDQSALDGLLVKLNGRRNNNPTEITENAVPTEVKLYQNYPNPFNPVTSINFALSKASEVKLSVYNISGQKVAELADGVMNAGSHSVEFDGSRLNSGVYYYTLEADGVSMTKKLILMK